MPGHQHGQQQHAQHTSRPTTSGPADRPPRRRIVTAQRSQREALAHDQGEPVGDLLSLRDIAGLDHHPDERLGAGRAAAAPGR